MPCIPESSLVAANIKLFFVRTYLFNILSSPASGKTATFVPQLSLCAA
jgi:hypothetical protein